MIHFVAITFRQKDMLMDNVLECQLYFSNDMKFMFLLQFNIKIDIFSFFSECLYNIPIFTVPLMHQAKWSFSSSSPSLSHNFLSSSLTLSSSLSSVSSSFPNNFPFSAISRKNKRPERMNYYLGALSLEQVVKINSHENDNTNSNNSHDTSKYQNSHFEHLNNFEDMPNVVNYKEMNLNENAPIEIEIYLRIPKTVAAGERITNWSWVDAETKSNKSSINNKTGDRATVMLVKMPRLDIFRSQNTNDIKNIKICTRNKFLIKHSSDNLNYTLTEDISSFKKKNKTTKEKENDNTTYTYLKLAIISGKNLLDLNRLKNVLTLHLTFFQNINFHTSGMANAVPSSCASSGSIQNLQKLVQVVYVINHNRNKTFTKHSSIHDSSKVRKNLAQTRDITTGFESHKWYDISNKNAVSSTPFQTKLKKFKEFVSSKVIHYPSKSQAISTSHTPLFKIANNNRSPWVNKENALRTNSSHLSNSDLIENVETLVSSNLLQPSSMSSSYHDTRKNTLSNNEWKNLQQDKFLTKSTPKIYLKSANENYNRESSWNERMCENWLDVHTKSPLVEISYKSNNDQQTDANSGFTLQKSHKDSLNSSVQTYCAAQIRLPHGYWPSIKVTVIQGKPFDFE